MKLLFTCVGNSMGQVVVDYVAMTPSGKVFDSSLTRGAPYDVRVGAGQVPAHVLAPSVKPSTLSLKLPCCCLLQRCR